MRYDRPDSLPAALELLAAEPRTLLAGGTDLYVASDAATLPGPVLDLGGIAGLDGIERTADGVRIGAGTRWATIRDAALIGHIDSSVSRVVLDTELGGARYLEELEDDPLPRIRN